MKKENRIVFHGTPNKEIADKILKEGFKKGTYFARHLEDAIGYGGKYIFYVALKVDNKSWEIINRRKISPKRIKQLACFNPKELYYNEKAGEGIFEKGDKVPCSNCGADIGEVRLSILGKPVIAKCPKCKMRFN